MLLSVVNWPFLKEEGLLPLFRRRTRTKRYLKTGGSTVIKQVMSKTLYWANIRLISGITEHCQNVNLPSIALFLDFKKAFDGIEWDFLIKALETFGFGNLLVKWIKTVHTKPESCVTDNGFANTLFFHWNAELDRGAPFPEFCLLLPSSF